MRKIIKNTFIFITIIGVFALAVNFIYQTNEITIVKPRTFNIGTYKWNFYTIDIKQYLINLQNALDIRRYFNIIPNTPDTPTPPGNNLNVVGWLSFVAKCILTGLNYVIYAFNIILAPVKLLTYPVMIIYSILGLDTTNMSAVKALNTINELFIPYIPITF